MTNNTSSNKKQDKENVALPLNSFCSLYSISLPLAVRTCCALLAVGVTGSTLLPARVQAQQTAAEIDWRPWEELTEEQRLSVPDNCCGMYVAPPLLPIPNQAADAEGDRQAVHLGADDGGYDESTGIAELRGNVLIQQQSSQITGDSGHYNNKTGMVHLEGDIRVRQPGVLMTGASVDANQQTGEMRLDASSYLLHQAKIRGTADTILHTDGSGIVTIDNGRFTRCEPASNDWQIQASEIVLNQNSGRGTAKNMILRVADIPVLYAPWISFPINDERQSGFLAPSIGRTSNGGLDLETPYYFNLAPNYDATYTPRYMSDRGLQHNLEFRHQSSWSEQDITVGYLGSDDLYNATERALIDAALDNNDPRPDGDSPPREKRWYVNANHRGSFAERWSTLIDYTAFSDEEYVYDFSTNGLQTTAESYYTRTGQIRYSGDYWQLTSRLRSYQVLDPTINERRAPEDLLPEISLEGSYTDDWNINYDLNVNYTYFDRNVDLDDIAQRFIDDGELAEGGRLLVEPEISYTWSTPGIFVTPSLRYYYAQYDLQDQALGASPTPDRGVWSASVDSGLIFERPVSFFGESFMQTLEPQLFYLYTQYEDQDDLPEFDATEPAFSFNQLFRPNRFAGSDLVGDANQVTLALTSRLLDEDGREKMRVRIGQIFYLEDRQVGIKFRPVYREDNNTSSVSPMVLDLDYRLSDNWRFRGDIVWNSHTNLTEQGSIQFQYQSERDKIVNVGMRYRDEDREPGRDGLDRRTIQSDISVAWPITDSWDIVAKHSYDYANKRELETLAGVEYDSCCWRTRVVYREWANNNWNLNTLDLNYDSGLFVQFELKGLGSVLGGNVGEMLADTIYGYRQ